MLCYIRFVGAYTENSVIPSVRLLAYKLFFKIWGWGGFPKNLITQVSIFVILINILNINNAYARDTKNTYKQEYLYQLDYSFDQAYCLVNLIDKENTAWNIKAKNGSHYGLPQGRSEYLKTATYKQQITWHIKYMKHRYGVDRLGVANACGAWAHWLAKGWH